eukprot:1390525-Amorphochlora_amoeboformis.AAC.1
MGSSTSTEENEKRPQESKEKAAVNSTLRRASLIGQLKDVTQIGFNLVKLLILILIHVVGKKGD